MSKLSRYQARLTRVEARIADIEAAYPTIAKVKGYSQGFGAVSVTYQDFGAVGVEYNRLLDQQEWLAGEIDALTTGDDGGSSVASFRGVEV